MKKVIFATGVAALVLASVVSAQGYTFSTNLTVGSTGPAVVSLQTALISAGFNIPSISSGAVAKGYFGSQTQAAVKQYQSSKGVPSTGFVGPLTRAALNGGSVATTGGSCPAGYVCTPTGGSTTGTGMTGITTAGVPGIMSVSAGPLSSAVLHVGDQMAPVQAIRVNAQYSDLDVQSITLNVGNNTAFYNKLVNTIYVTDGTNILATQPVNGSTVVQSGSEYILGIAGFHFIVPKGTYKDLVIKASFNGSLDSAYINGTKVPNSTNGIQNSINGVATNGWGIGVIQNGLRSVDGAGLNLYGPAGTVNQNFTINSSTVDSATANLSLDPASPLVATVPVSDTTNGQYLGLPVLTFDVNAQNDSLHLRNVNVKVFNTGAGTVSAAYLFQGSTQIASASVTSNTASFTNISNGTAGASIPVNTTVPFTVKVDITGVTAGSAIVTAGVATTSSSDLTILSSNDSTATISGSAQGNTQTVSSAGPLFTLVGTPTITKSSLSDGVTAGTLYQYTASFNVNVQAIGQNVLLGLTASGSPAFGSSTAITDVTNAQIYQNGVATSSQKLIASYSQPTNTTLTSNTFTVARNQSVTIPVTYSFTILNGGANTYAVQMNGIYTNGPVLTSFMSGQPAWRSASI